jgi:hypothetical protein
MRDDVEDEYLAPEPYEKPIDPKEILLKENILQYEQNARKQDMREKDYD